METWTIVKFQDENTVEAVPTGWMIGNDECYWPPWPAEKLTNAIKNSEKANSCWPSFKVTCFRNSTYDSYWLARSKARKAEETSDLNSESDNQLKRISRQKILSSSESEDDLQLIRSPPKIRKNISEIATTAISQQDRADCHLTSNFPSTSNPNKSFGNKERQCPTSCVTNSPLNVLHEIVNETTPTSRRISAVTFNQNSQREFESVVCSCCPVYNNGKYLKKFLQQNHLLRALIGDLAVEIRTIKENKGNTNIESLFHKFNFPIKLMEDLEELENYLIDPIIFANAVTEISKVGGCSPYNFVKRAMALLITNEIAIRYSWLGRKGNNPFYSTRIAKLLISAADEGKASKTQRERTEVAISSWLKQANERNKNMN